MDDGKSNMSNVQKIQSGYEMAQVKSDEFTVRSYHQLTIDSIERHVSSQLVTIFLYST